MHSSGVIGQIVTNSGAHHESGPAFALHALQQSQQSAQPFGSSAVVATAPHVTPVVSSATVISA
ncbi:unnamed protein product, partial [Sphagnum jensenii]